MSDPRCGAGRACAAALTACLFWAGCGPSASEIAARAGRSALQLELAEARQYNEDLKFRLQLAQARNKLLTGLVQGLTADPDHNTQVHEKLAGADASLQSIDRDVDALLATLRTSRQNADALREQRDALQRELADARHTIEHALASQAAIDARMLALQRIVAPLSEFIRAGRVNVSIEQGRFSVELPEALLFAQAQSKLSEDGKALLDQVVAGLRTAPDRHVRVLGPTEPVGKRTAAQRELTLARSLALLDHLRASGVTAESAVITTHERAPMPSGARYYALSLVPTAEELPHLPSPEQLLGP